MTEAEAHEWFEAALELDLENQQLRAWLSALVWWVWQCQELHEYAAAAIARRWPQERT